jgi:hypothetical protein
LIDFASFDSNGNAAVALRRRFETFVQDTTRHATLNMADKITKAFAAHGMTVVGPLPAGRLCLLRARRRPPSSRDKQAGFEDGPAVRAMRRGSALC